MNFNCLLYITHNYKICYVISSKKSQFRAYIPQEIPDRFVWDTGYRQQLKPAYFDDYGITLECTMYSCYLPGRLGCKKQLTVEPNGYFKAVRLKGPVLLMVKSIVFNFDRCRNYLLFTAGLHFNVCFVFIENQDETVSQSPVALFTYRLRTHLDKQHLPFSKCFE